MDQKDPKATRIHLLDGTEENLPESAGVEIAHQMADPSIPFIEYTVRKDKEGAYMKRVFKHAMSGVTYYERNEEHEEGE